MHWRYRPVVLLFVFLTGCVNLPNTDTLKIDGRSVAFADAGQGSPVVVLETGMGPTMNTWHAIFEKVAEFTRVFAYNRPGYGNSSAKNPPMTAQDLAEQLDKTLVQKGLNSPYLLVGHSAGGLYVNAFARMYPKKVAGVVLIDSSHPAQFTYLKNEKPILYSTLLLSAAWGRRSYESNIIKGIENEFQSLGPFPNVPLVVLTSEKSSLFETRKMRCQWLEFQQELAAMSTNSKHTIVEGSWHFIQKDKPAVVIQAIRNVVDEVRQANQQ